MKPESATVELSFKNIELPSQSGTVEFPLTKFSNSKSLIPTLISEENEPSMYTEYTPGGPLMIPVTSPVPSEDRSSTTMTSSLF